MFGSKQLALLDGAAVGLIQREGGAGEESLQLSTECFPFLIISQFFRKRIFLLHHTEDVPADRGDGQFRMPPALRAVETRLHSKAVLPTRKHTTLIQRTLLPSVLSQHLLHTSLVLLSRSMLQIRFLFWWKLLEELLVVHGESLH